jgi:hypothetical protein
MTAEKVDGDRVKCVWLNAMGKSERNTFVARAPRKFAGRRAILPRASAP